MVSMAGWLLCGLGLLSSLSAQSKPEPAFLQKGTIKFDKHTLSGDARRSTPGSKELGQDWWVIEVKFDTFAPLTDELTLKFTTDMVDTLKKQDDQAETTVLLQGELTFLNVPQGKGHQAAMFLHPTSVIRYGGIRGQEGIRKANVRVELYEKGELVDALDMKQEKDDWVEVLKKQGITEVTGVLLRPDQVPFYAFEFLKFNQIKSVSR